MMLTALDCVKNHGLTFAAVHDSFWTHACDMNTMNSSLREQFVGLYSLPLLERFRDSLALRYPDIVFPPLPPRGTLDLEQVKQSKYFFS
jgi:DNA-directed RNA polymerase, mitochondrial